MTSEEANNPLHISDQELSTDEPAQSEQLFSTTPSLLTRNQSLLEVTTTKIFKELTNFTTSSTTTAASSYKNNTIERGAWVQAVLDVCFWLFIFTVIVTILQVSDEETKNSQESWNCKPLACMLKEYVMHSGNGETVQTFSSKLQLFQVEPGTIHRLRKLKASLMSDV